MVYMGREGTEGWDMVGKMQEGCEIGEKQSVFIHNHRHWFYIEEKENRMLEL